MKDPQQIDRYLFDEMSEQERTQLEDTFVEDEALFYDILERENDLIDRYTGGELSGDELERFERTLATNLARRQKTANSRLLREFISDEKQGSETITIAERSGFFARLSELFTFRSAALQFASGALILLFALWSTYLLVENRRLKSIEQDLASARGREAELQSQIDTNDQSLGDLTADLNSERERIKQLEEELAKVRKTGDGNTSTTNVTAPPTIATLVLGAIGRDGRPFVPRLELQSGVSRVSVRVTFDASVSERVSVLLNGETVANGIRIIKSGEEKTVLLTVPVSRLVDGRNTLEILDPSGAKVAEHAFLVSRK